MFTVLDGTSSGQSFEIKTYVSPNSSMTSPQHLHSTRPFFYKKKKKKKKRGNTCQSVEQQTEGEYKSLALPLLTLQCLKIQS